MTTVRQLRRQKARQVNESVQRALDQGARRITNLILRDPEAVAALATLESEHGTTTAAITHAIKLAAHAQ